MRRFLRELGVRPAVAFFFLLLALVRLGALARIILLLLSGGDPDAVARGVIIALLFDLGAVILLWLLNASTKTLRKRVSVSLICSPLVLLGMFATSIVAAGLVPGSESARAADIVAYCFSFAYLALSYVFLAIDTVRLISRRGGGPSIAKTETAKDAVARAKIR